MHGTETQQIPRVALTVDEAAASIGIDPRSLRRWDGAGIFGPRILKIGGAARVGSAELEAWIAAGAPPRDDWNWRGASA